jgi:predicted RND superfamily exporter protein
MAVAVIGGVISSTLLSLIVVPVFYLAIENLKAWLGRFRRRGKDAQPTDALESATSGSATPPADALT